MTPCSTASRSAPPEGESLRLPILRGSAFGLLALLATTLPPALFLPGPSEVAPLWRWMSLGFGLFGLAHLVVIGALLGAVGVSRVARRVGSEDRGLELGGALLVLVLGTVLLAAVHLRLESTLPGIWLFTCAWITAGAVGLGVVSGLRGEGEGDAPSATAAPPLVDEPLVVLLLLVIAGSIAFVWWRGERRDHRRAPVESRAVAVVTPEVSSSVAERELEAEEETPRADRTTGMARAPRLTPRPDFVTAPGRPAPAPCPAVAHWTISRLSTERAVVHAVLEETPDTPVRMASLWYFGPGVTYSLGPSTPSARTRTLSGVLKIAPRPGEEQIDSGGILVVLCGEQRQLFATRGTGGRQMITGVVHQPLPEPRFRRPLGEDRALAEALMSASIPGTDGFPAWHPEGRR